MLPLEQMEELKQLQEMCLSLEEQAGLSEAMERAREGRFIPLGATGDQTSPEEHIADKDHFRNEVRDVYFSVQEIELRRKLIAAQRKIHAMRFVEADIPAADRTVSIVMAKMRNQAWATAAVIAVSAMAVGYWAFDLGGAIAGAIAGFSYALGIVSKAKNNARIELEQARKNQAQRFLWPECFSLSEEITGEREGLYRP